MGNWSEGQLCAPIWNDWEKTTIAFSAALMQLLLLLFRVQRSQRVTTQSVTAIQICFEYFTTDVDISQLTFCLMFPARAFEMREKLGRWQEQQLSAIFTAILPPYHLSSSLPAFFFSRTFFNHGCSWVANVVVMLAGFCVIDFLGAFGCHGASWRWNPLSSSEPMFLWCWIFVIGGSTLYIVPWIIRTCFGFKSPFGEASTQVTSTTCRKMRRCWVMSGPVVTLKRRKMWCSIHTQVVIPATKDYSYFWKDFKEKYCEGCLPRVYILEHRLMLRCSCICLFQSHPLGALLILILLHCSCNIGLIIGWETSLMNMYYLL
jgi:fumarate reductase subunit D